MEHRQTRLRRNFKLMFWIQAFLNVKLIALLSTIFYLHRGMTASEVFYISIVWSVVIVLLELPSSYLADKWGRKKLIWLGCSLNLGTLVIYLFSYGFWLNALAIAFLAASYAFLSGTDEALVFDTGKELGEGKESLKNLGKYYSGQRVFKIFTPVIAALIVNQMSAEQFDILIYIDISTVVVALLLASRLLEPNHFMDVEKMEKGALRDALKVFSLNSELAKATLSKTLIFIAAFLVWRIQQDYFLDLGLNLLVIGLFWGLMQLLVYVGSSWLHKLEKRFDTSILINYANLSFVMVLALFVGLGFLFKLPLLLILLNTLYQAIEALRAPIYSHYFNQKSASYNRATTLSISSMLKSFLDIPLLFLGSVLVSYDTRYVFVLALVLAVGVLVITRLKPQQDLI